MQGTLKIPNFTKFGLAMTNPNDQSPPNIQAFQYKHIPQEVVLLIYCQPSTYRRIDSV